MNDDGEPCSASLSRIKLLFAAIASAEVLKQLALLSLGQTQPWGDSPGYWSLAGDAASGDWWLSSSGVAYRTPGYPCFLAVCRVWFGTNALLAAVLLQHACVVATSLATTWITWRITQRLSCAAIAWGWCALSTARPLYANWLLTESLATCALTLMVATMLLAWAGRPLWWMIVSSLLLGCGILIRPVLIAAVPALLWGAWACERTPRRWVTPIVSLIVLAVLLTPWCVRNQLQFQRFTLTVFTGRQLWKSAFDPWPGGELPVPTDGAGAQVRERIPEDGADLRHNWTVNNALARSGMLDHEVDRLMEQAAWQAIARHPGQFSFRLLARCATFWYVREWTVDMQDVDRMAFADQARLSVPIWHSEVQGLLCYTPERWFPAMWAWSIATWIGLAALITHPAQCRTGWLLAYLFLGTTILTAALEVPVYRYRLVLEPLMIVSAVAGLAQLFVRERKL